VNLLQSFKIVWPNAILLVVPLLLWNIVLGPKITTEAILSDANSPRWLLFMENLTRLAIFILPLFMSLKLDDAAGRLGMAIYIAGTLIYFATWAPLILAPDTNWSQSTAGLLAPRITPLIPFIGIAMIGSWWPYAGLSVIFISLHILHGVQNL
jgi:hypothetical protein